MKRILDMATSVAEIGAIATVVLAMCAAPIAVIWFAVYLISTAWHAGG